MRERYSFDINTAWCCGGALALLLVLPGCRATKPAAPPDPFGPIRSIQEIRQTAPALAGQVVRLRGRIGSVRDLNPGMLFPWDVVYTLEDDTGSIPVHWLAHEQRPEEIKPPALAAGDVIVTGRVRQDVELEGTRYPLLIHELTALHNQERPTLPASPAPR